MSTVAYTREPPSSSTTNDAESFQGLLLRFRGRSGLSQHRLAERLGINRRSVQEWENGTNYPSPERLEALVRVLLEARGLTVGQEVAEARALWAAVTSASPRTHPPFDDAWLVRVLAGRSASALSEPPVAPTGITDNRADWGDAPDVRGFVNRTDELALLRCWTLEERCRLVSVLGMAGIGKTILSSRLARDVSSSFECVYWRSLRDVVSASDWLAGAIDFLSDQKLELPSGAASRLRLLLQLLRERRCLLVLDNLESVLESGECTGSDREELAAYRHVLEVLGQAAHQSCVLLTSREAPPDLVALTGRQVRTLELRGLEAQFIQQLLAPRQLVGTTEQWTELTARMGGNPRALIMIAETINELFGGDIGMFLQVVGTGGVFGGVRRLLAEQVERSSAFEQQVMCLLAHSPAPMTLKELRLALRLDVGYGTLVDAVDALRRRSLVESTVASGAPAFMLQPALMEYVTERQAA